MGQGTTLLGLADADLQIGRLERKLDEMPEKRAILEARKKTIEVKQLRAKAEELVSRLERDASRNEDETAQISEKIDSEQAKLMSGSITNPKEVQHISREMDALRRRKEKLEIDNLALLERIEKAQGQLAKIDAALAQLASREESLTDEFRSKGGEIQTALDSLKNRRNDLTAELDADTVERYERARASKQGVGAGALDGTACTACRMELPAERVDELLSGPEIAMCPACRRLLVVTPSSEDE